VAFCFERRFERPKEIRKGKKMEKIVNLRQIGVVHSRYRELGDAPFQGKHTKDESTLEVFEAYEPALLDIEHCSHLIVLYWQDKANRGVLQTRTPWGPKVHGVFATRSPNRPNPIGLCVADLLERRGRFLRVGGMDALDGSPLVDIKPYSLEVDSVRDARIGWHRRGDIGPDRNR
jgi:formylmethanofuran dehydrogenase subunit E